MKPISCTGTGNAYNAHVLTLTLNYGLIAVNKQNARNIRRKSSGTSVIKFYSDRDGPMLRKLEHFLSSRMNEKYSNGIKIDAYNKISCEFKKTVDQLFNIKPINRKFLMDAKKAITCIYIICDLHQKLVNGISGESGAQDWFKLIIGIPDIIEICERCNRNVSVESQEGSLFFSMVASLGKKFNEINATKSSISSYSTELIENLLKLEVNICENIIKFLQNLVIEEQRKAV